MSEQPIEQKKSDTAPGVSVEEKILKEFIPDMLYCKSEKRAFSDAEGRLRVFLKRYRFPEDIQAIVTMIESTDVLGDREYQLLELYAKKIGSVIREDFGAAEKYTLSIHRLIDPPTDDRENG